MEIEGEVVTTSETLTLLSAVVDRLNSAPSRGRGAFNPKLGLHTWCILADTLLLSTE